MSYPSSPRHGPTSSQGASDAAAALKGASLAFSKNSTKPKPAPSPPAKNQNLRVAAPTRSASRDRSTSPSHSPVPSQNRQTTSSGLRGDQLARDGPSEQQSGGLRDRLTRPASAASAGPMTNLTTPSGQQYHHPQLSSRPTSHDPKNPSFIAATLAASRTASSSPHARPPVAGHQVSMPDMRATAAAAARSTRRDSHDSGSGTSSADLPDTTSIPRTNSLITMFEPRSDDADGVDPVKKSPAVALQRVDRDKPRPKPKIRPMTPERPLSPKDGEATSVKAATAREVKGPSPPTWNESAPKLKLKPAVSSDEPQPGPPADVKAKPPVARKPTARDVEMKISGSTQSLRSKTSESESPNGRPTPGQSKTASPPPKSTRLKPETVSHTNFEPDVLAPTSKLQPRTLAKSATPPPPTKPKTKKPQLESIEIPQPRVVSRSTPEVLSPHPTRPTPHRKMQPPTPPQPRGSVAKSKAEPEPAAPPTRENMTSLTVGRSSPISPDDRPATSGTSSSNNSFVSASSNQTPKPASPAPPRRRADSIQRPSSTAGKPTGSPSRKPAPAPALPRRNNPAATSSSTSLPLNSLSNAIMAGSLAASRLTPSNTGASGGGSGGVGAGAGGGNGSLAPLPPLPRRQKSPRLRQTLRQPAPVSDDEEAEARRIRKHHGHHTRSNKGHFHHEGARKRWREEIKEGERKRYEALWASNRGVLHEWLVRDGTGGAGAEGSTSSNRDLSDYVLNVVVRDIWRRSRLPDDELAEVWELVDRNAGGGGGGSGQRNANLPPKGMLGKVEFVVGTWIIDQRLRGRKIPVKVSGSVWDSARGVKVWVPKTKVKEKPQKWKK